MVAINCCTIISGEDPIKFRQNWFAWGGVEPVSWGVVGVLGGVIGDTGVAMIGIIGVVGVEGVLGFEVFVGVWFIGVDGRLEGPKSSFFVGSVGVTGRILLRIIVKHNFLTEQNVLHSLCGRSLPAHWHNRRWSRFLPRNSVLRHLNLQRELPWNFIRGPKIKRYWYHAYGKFVSGLERNEI